ncbi:hypothetical protein OROMI_022944 [Orobanche minor]
MFKGNNAPEVANKHLINITVEQLKQFGTVIQSEASKNVKPQTVN